MCVAHGIHIWTVNVSMYLSSVHDIRMERSEPVEYCDIDCVNSCSDHWSEKCACIRDGNALPNQHSRTIDGLLETTFRFLLATQSYFQL